MMLRRLTIVHSVIAGIRIIISLRHQFRFWVLRLNEIKSRLKTQGAIQSYYWTFVLYSLSDPNKNASCLNVTLSAHISTLPLTGDQQRGERHIEFPNSLTAGRKSIAGGENTIKAVHGTDIPLWLAGFNP